ncbi:protein PAL OF QUIRKY-like [Amaranthus tricolor]|uniref:protein PAL OF QUIRKY-like n=1 Tax=Amaranthus tricolor TaxID=29722 RepID=UPI002585D68D|nr:protein PAL OF QUIRKY-like [Amaranthus tricolor]
MATQNKTLNLTSTKKVHIKFLYSYGGEIRIRPTDGLLRYVGGFTRVLSVFRSITFSELMAKLENLCGFSVYLRCQLPSEDLDVLVSIKSNDDLYYIIEEYDKASFIYGKEVKIRAILSPKSSPPTTSSSSSSGAYLSPINSERRKFVNQKTPIPVVRFAPPARHCHNGIVRDCCHYQANSRR